MKRFQGERRSKNVGSNSPHDVRQQTHEASIRHVCSLFLYRSQIVEYFASAQTAKLFPFHLIELILRSILFCGCFIIAV